MTVLDQFRFLAPEFAKMEDGAVEQWITMTRPMLSQKRFGRVYEQALALLTAHRLKLAGYGDNPLGSIGDMMRVGSYSEGSVSVSFSASPAGNSQIDGDLPLTTYGAQFLALRKSCIVSILSAGEL